MATRKTAAKAPAAKASKPAAKAESKPAAAAPKHAAPASAKTPRAAAAPRPAATPAPAATPKKTARPEVPTGEARYRWITHAAYLRAEKRGFAPGREVDDWLAAEAEFLAIHGIG
jgi:hypothetical protein